MTRDQIIDAAIRGATIRHVPTDGRYVLGDRVKSRVAFGEWVDAIEYATEDANHSDNRMVYVRPLDQFHNFVEVSDDER